MTLIAYTGMLVSSASWDEERSGGMVLVQDQEWHPPHFTKLKRGFGSNGAHVTQERGGLYMNSLTG
jgi:hypothetical protein